MSDISAEADTGDFEAEFDAAREAELGPDEAGDVSEDSGEDEAPPPKPEKSESEKAAASLQKALKAERRERQALQARLEELSTKVATPAPVAPASQWKGMPDPEADPIGALQFLQQAVARQAEEEERASHIQRQNEAATRQVQQIATTMEQHEDDFRDDQPDYDDAVKFLREKVLDEYLDNGWSKAEAEEKMAREFLGLVPTAIRAGKNPAEVAYKMAVKRGFGKGLDKAAGKIETIRQGQKAASTLSSGGSQTGRPMSATSIANLKGAAFDAAFEKYRAQERRR